MRQTWVRITFTVGLVAVALSLIGLGGLAGWQASTVNPGNSFATGSLHMSNSDGSCTDTSGTCTAILTASGMKPGSVSTGTVTITNTGSLAGDYTLSESSVTPTPGSSPLCSDLTLVVKDDASTPNQIYSGALGSLPSSTLSVDNPFAATNGAHTYTFTVTLPNSSTNADEGSTCSVAFDWTAIPH